MRELDARAIEQLQALYEAAAEDVRRDIAAAAGGADLVPDHALRRLLASIEETITRLGQQRDALLAQNIAEAAQLGVRPFTLQGVAAVGGAQAVLTTGSAATVAADAVQFVMGARQADGLILSDRLWRLDQGAKEVLQRAIGSAVVRGISAARAAQQLITQGQRVPDALSQAIDGARLGRLAKLADILVSGDGAEVWKAERVFRTELNRAHGEAYMAGAIQAPGFAGFRFLLSPRHPRPDVCLREGSLVTLTRGQVPIEHVHEGDWALTHAGRWRRVTRLYRHLCEAQPLVRLRCPGANSHSQPLVLTGNHPVLTPEGWTRADALRTGSLVACRIEPPGRKRTPTGDGEECTAPRRSDETASARVVGSSGLEPHGASDQACRIPRNWGQCAQRPTLTRTSGAAMSQRVDCPPSTLDCRSPFDHATNGSARPLCAGTCWGDVCQSWGLPLHASAHTPGGSASAEGWGARMWRRIQHTFAAVWRALSSSRTSSSSCARKACAGEPGSVTRTPHTAGSPGCCAPEPRTSCCSTSLSWSASPLPIAEGSASSTLRRSDKGELDASCGFPLTWHQPIIERVDTRGEFVYNLEVDEDHSYVAQGIVVHNCDLLAAQNIHGLGPGVYPTRELTPWPAHPNTLSFLVAVFEDEVSEADRAGKETPLQALQRLGPEIRAGVLGATKAEYFDQGLLTRGMLRARLRSVEERLQRQGKLS